jgi:Mn2+/Fe2+ NRAMP family transporter
MNINSPERKIIEIPARESGQQPTSFSRRKWMIVFAQSVTIFLVPFIGIAMFAVSNDGKIMGRQKNTVAVKIFGSLGLLILVLLAISNVNELFLK